MRLRTFYILIAAALSVFSQVASAGSTASATVVSRSFEIDQCPPIQVCNSQGCGEPASSPAATTIEFQGLKIPNARTNFPMINAGLHYLLERGSIAYLEQALRLICVPQKMQMLRCSEPIDSGQAPCVADDVFPIWDSVGFVPDSTAESAAEKQLDACQDYQRLSATVLASLAPEVALQSHPYSEEGIKLRVNLMKGLSFRPVIEGRCNQEAGSVETLRKPCIDLRAYFEDLKFAQLLADKLAFDAKPRKAWDLIRATDHSIFALGLIAMNSARPDKPREAFTQAVLKLLFEDWPVLRASIQRAL